MIKKRIMSLLLALSSLIFTVNLYSQDENSGTMGAFSFSEASGQPGSHNNKVAVKLNTSFYFGSGVVIVYYDPSLLQIRSIKKSAPSNFKKVKDFVYNEKGSVLVTFLEAGMDSKKFDNEELFEIRFDVAEDAPEGTTPLEFGNCVLANANRKLLPHTRQSGSFNVTEKSSNAASVALASASSPEGLPNEFSLSQNHPNPFNPSTTISFQVPQTDGLQTILASLKIYDARGRLVKTLMDENLLPDYYSVHWDGTNDNGEKVSSGTYFYTITAGELRETKKMIVLK